ncbi:SDR family NAD(P)-dependent oxidoreductase [Bacillus bingmayongensis]|uniref:SDR family NAD(P)-dependent oxidoreductase n=1 Tax=Bacillus bingmayongensis TaxID=1150157 RepID=UPI001C8EE192|nr:SDR family oxidoreductase [Bacillus bingmayongensis]MBY0600234.1 SDR family oxidoreductase [Bacillus bingmayongensis]
MNTNNLFDLTGKVVVVTGGAGYLGQAISEGIAEAGATVYIVSSNEEKCKVLSEELSKKNRTKCKSGYLNIQDELTIQDCFSKIIEENGQIDVLINNASFSALGNAESMTESNWLKGFDGTINGVFRCTKAVLPIMIDQKGGSIINVSSMYGIVSPNPEIYGNSGLNNPPNYGAGKAAINQFTRYVACHYGKYGIRTNSVSPGPFPNEEIQKNTSFIEHLKNKNPLGRIGKPEDLKGVMVFLASSASSYITGENICIDGGWTAW